MANNATTAEESDESSAQEMKLFDNDGWLMASDEPAGTIVPSESERWLAIDQPVEVRR